MLERYLAVGALMFLAACNSKAPEQVQQLTEAELRADASAAASEGPSSTPEATAPGPDLPDQAAKRAIVDNSLRGVWRETPYEILDLRFGAEKARAVGSTGTEYEADIAIVLKFPSGWAAECAGPGAKWGCQFLDPTMMQMKPIPVGESRSYSGKLTMRRYRRDGEWESHSGTWQQVAPKWDGNVKWEMRRD